MILSDSQLQTITRGGLTYKSGKNGFSFDRFTDAQKEYLHEYNGSFYTKAFQSASGVIDFTTDSKTLSFGYTVSAFGTRNYYYFDVYENDTMIHHFGDEDGMTKSGYVSLELSEGEKRIRIYTPNMQRAEIIDFTLDDGAAVVPTERKLRALILGDSITHGYDARYPSLSYANLLAEEFSLNAINQAIGGEVFNPAALGDAPLFTPDVITVAYGINDWSKVSDEQRYENADEYFKKLAALYPGVKIIYISPIWTNPERKPTRHHTLAPTIARFEKIAKENGAAVIHGYDLVPHDKGMFTDGLHPTELGFTQYAKNLIKEIKAAGIL